MQQDKIAFIVNTISKNNDIWKCFFDSIKQYTTPTLFNKKYIFLDDDLSKISNEYQICKYNPKLTYKQQFCSCIKEVEEEYCIYVSEDYVLCDNVDEQRIKEFKKILRENPSLSFIRLMRGGVYDGPFEKHSDNLYYVPQNKEYFYTNQAALWRTEDLKKIHDLGPDLHIANKDWQNSFEYQATKICNELNIQGLFCYYGENKRGIYHYDSSIFPHISTALVKGKWNMSEYPIEMGKLVKQYNIDLMKRGWV
tara:strand:+ start:1233 stop:1988 length:756 start_codon:yes stop_codon:yes gene_type:complete